MASDGDLFDWCAARPRWQQEAIRLLTAKPKLDTEELDQLEEAVKAEAGLIADKPPAWPALTKTHLKAGNKFAPVTVLGSIGPLRNIDRLAAEQPPLRSLSTASLSSTGPMARARAAIAASQRESATVCMT